MPAGVYTSYYYPNSSNASYQTTLAGYRKRYRQAVSQLDTLGTQQREDLASQYAAAQARGMQDLRNRGLGALSSSIRYGYQRSYADALAGLNDTLTRERLGYQTGLSKDLLDYQQWYQGQQSANSLAWAQLARQNSGLRYLGATPSSSRQTLGYGFTTTPTYSYQLGSNFLPRGRYIGSYV